MKIEQASERHIDNVAILFDLYRQFYQCEPDLELATDYIGARIRNAESMIFVAMRGADALGFVQLYPSFCSVDAIKIEILHDLYVAKSARGSGVGQQLMARATEFAKESGAKRIDLLTDETNMVGQHLYEKLNYNRANEEFYAYSLTL